jgi:hypothetical protein
VETLGRQVDGLRAVVGKLVEEVGALAEQQQEQQRAVAAQQSGHLDLGSLEATVQVQGTSGACRGGLLGMCCWRLLLHMCRACGTAAALLGGCLSGCMLLPCTPPSLGPQQHPAGSARATAL